MRTHTRSLPFPAKRFGRSRSAICKRQEKSSLYVNIGRQYEQSMGKKYKGHHPIKNWTLAKCKEPLPIGIRHESAKVRKFSFKVGILKQKHISPQNICTTKDIAVRRSRLLPHQRQQEPLDTPHSESAIHTFHHRSRSKS